MLKCIDTHVPRLKPAVTGAFRCSDKFLAMFISVRHLEVVPQFSSMVYEVFLQLASEFLLRERAHIVADTIYPSSGFDGFETSVQTAYFRFQNELYFNLDRNDKSEETSPPPLPLLSTLVYV